MREACTLSLKRVSPWLILVASAAFVASWAGLLPAPGDMAAWLANQPELEHAFEDPSFGRTNALVLLVSLLFFGPVLAIVAGYAGLFVLSVVAEFLRPAFRWLGLPEWTATALAGGLLTGVAYAQAGLWVPRSLWFLGLVVRACRTALV